LGRKRVPPRRVRLRVGRERALAYLMKKPGKAEKWAARSERLAAALRENLKRRKAQARGRAAAAGPAGDPAAAVRERKMKSPDFRRNPGNE
jgi:hypothetical protein